MARLPFPRRVVLAVILVVLLTAPAAMEAQARPRNESRPADVIKALISNLRALWPHLGYARNRDGCSYDPRNTCEPGTTDGMGAATETKEGCTIDPHGGCKH